MTPAETAEFVRQAEALYDLRWRAALEANHLHEFVAIEPISGDYFLGPTMSSALAAARRHYPDRLAHALRIGHPAALHFGLQQ